MNLINIISDTILSHMIVLSIHFHDECYSGEPAARGALRFDDALLKGCKIRLI